MGIVMAVQDTDASVKSNEATRMMCIFTAIGCLLGLPWLLGAYYAVHHEAQKLARFLGVASLFTLIFPIAALVASEPQMHRLLKSNACDVRSCSL